MGHIFENVWVNDLYQELIWIFFQKYWNYMNNNPWSPNWVILSDLVKFSAVTWLTCFHGCMSLCSFPRLLLSDFDVQPLKSKLRASSTRIWSNFATRSLYGTLKWQKCVQNCSSLWFLACFCHCKASYRPSSGQMILCSCWGCVKLQFEWVFKNKENVR